MGKVIKKSSSGDLTTMEPDGLSEKPFSKRAPIIDKDTFEAKSDAQQIRQKAMQEAEEIKKAAMAEGEQIKQQAREEGYMEGKAAGAEELTEMIATSSQRLQMIEEQVEPQLKDLALRIARKILGRELEFHPEAVVDIVKQALSDKARQRREVYLRVNPDDLQYIREHKAELLEVLGRAKEIGLREDPGVEPHGVIIETDAGTIDAQLETQLAVFERVFKGLH
ncbi:MAG: flagellar assembly protein FliH [Myxococcales bacterium]|nr:flagellar assembly protein FliH [Myxococcales bacterium]